MAISERDAFILPQSGLTSLQRMAALTQKTNGARRSPSTWIYSLADLEKAVSGNGPECAFQPPWFALGSA
jgi:hypothetical protein